MPGIKHQVLELVRLINEDVVDAHLLEIYYIVLVLIHLVLDGGYLGGQVLLTLDKTFEHTTADVVALLFQHFQIFLDSIKFRLKNLLLHLRRLWNLAELVVRHYHTVIVVVLDIVEEIHTLVCLETLFIGKQYPGIGIGRLIGHGNLGYIGFQTDNHRFVSQPETLHLMRCNTHYQRFTCPNLVVADATAVLFQHPYTVLLALINGADSIAVSEDFHVQIRKSLMRTIILRSDEAVELVVIEVNEFFLELRRLGFEPLRETVSYFVNLGIGKLDSLIVRNFYVFAVFIFTRRLLDVRNSVMKGVFQQAHTVVCAVIASDTELLPNGHVLSRCLSRILVH